MKPILEIENLGKKYKIWHQANSGYVSLRERLVDTLTFKSLNSEEVWVLKNVSFNVSPGECVGIIGSNGAGKSTLLKILSKITLPTEGRVVARGRVASLLEVGTGFHPELSGRENIFFNGSLLGMKRREIQLKFDEIVDFSGVGKFLDTPLKHYSSGMQLRLAFAVAAFLEPEILIIDEVLAVGDSEFQKKCLGKMESVSKSGRTILFVSHNMMFIQNLCKRTIMLRTGHVELDGISGEVIQSYLNHDSEKTMSGDVDLQNVKRTGTGKVLFSQIRIGSGNNVVKLGDEICFTIDFTNQGLSTEQILHVAITIFNQQGSKITTLDNLYSDQRLKTYEDTFQIFCKAPSLWLTPGRYSIDLWCADPYDTHDLIENAFTFAVEPGDLFGTGKVHEEIKHGNIIVENYWYNS